MSLPDEILLIILKKLNTIDVFYSLFGLNNPLNRIIHDPCFTTEVNFIDLINDTSRQTEVILEQFCLEILPNINNLIRRLKLRSTMLERILLFGDYANLSQLDIFIPDVEPVIQINGKKIPQS